MDDTTKANEGGGNEGLGQLGLWAQYFIFNLLYVFFFIFRRVKNYTPLPSWLWHFVVPVPPLHGLAHGL